MRNQFLTAILLTVVTATSALGGSEWQKFAVPSTGLSVELPVSIFTEDGGAPEGTEGRTFFTRDHRADLTVKSVPNPENDSPAKFLAKMQPPAGIIYKRITSDFFVVSSIRKDRIWYNRCNRGNGTMDCVLINYPAAEKRQWDSVVTRISHTLAN